MVSVDVKSHVYWRRLQTRMTGTDFFVTLTTRVIRDTSTLSKPRNGVIPPARGEKNKRKKSSAHRPTSVSLFSTDVTVSIWKMKSNEPFTPFAKYRRQFRADRGGKEVCVCVGEGSHMSLYSRNGDECTGRCTTIYQVQTTGGRMWLGGGGECGLGWPNRWPIGKRCRLFHG